MGWLKCCVVQISICGGLPELRTMTIPLMENLDVESETLARCSASTWRICRSRRMSSVNAPGN
jgi:hypothetical protein